MPQPAVYSNDFHWPILSAQLSEETTSMVLDQHYYFIVCLKFISGILFV